MARHQTQQAHCSISYSFTTCPVTIEGVANGIFINDRVSQKITYSQNLSLGVSLFPFFIRVSNKIIIYIISLKVSNFKTTVLQISKYTTYSVSLGLKILNIIKKVSLLEF